MPRYQTQIRSDNFLFVKTEEDHVIRLGQTSRNWLALIFLSLVEMGLFVVLISVIQKDPINWIGLGVSILLIAAIGWLMWILIRLLRISPMRFDSQVKAVRFNEDGLDQTIPFSEIRRIEMSYQPHPDVEMKNSGTYNIVAYLTGVRSVPIAQCSGKKVTAEKKANGIVALIEEVTGTGIKPVADMTAKMKTVKDVDLDSFNIGMIAQHLGRIQQEGGQGNFVVFSADDKANYYIQFAGQKGGNALYAEAAGNPVIPKNYRLDQEKQTKLLELGWTPPTQDGVNYSKQWQAVSYDDRIQIANTVMRTFVDVYGIDLDHPIDPNLVLE
jgi:hypothetical protein